MAIYRLLRGTTFFDPDAIAAMYAAYEEVCAELDLKSKNDRVTEIVALAIIEIAKSGERDPIALREAALQALGIKKP
jgi:hypothetical protein